LNCARAVTFIDARNEASANQGSARFNIVSLPGILVKDTKGRAPVAAQFEAGTGDQKGTNFMLQKGCGNVRKLYVCETPAQLKEFSADIDANVAKADQNWLKIGPQTYNTETHSFESPWPFGPEGGAQ
jgi:hypothetical protein